MWELEVSYDVTLDSRTGAALRGQRIDTFEAESLLDLARMLSQTLSLGDYRIEETVSPRIYLSFGGVRVRLTLYHLVYRETGHEILDGLTILQAHLQGLGTRISTLKENGTSPTH